MIIHSLDFFIIYLWLLPVQNHVLQNWMPCSDIKLWMLFEAGLVVFMIHKQWKNAIASLYDFTEVDVSFKLTSNKDRHHKVTIEVWQYYRNRLNYIVYRCQLIIWVTLLSCFGFSIITHITFISHIMVKQNLEVCVNGCIHIMKIK